MASVTCPLPLHPPPSHPCNHQFNSPFFHGPADVGRPPTPPAPPAAAPVAVAQAPSEAPAVVVVAYAPRHKPGIADASAPAAATPAQAGVEYTEVPQVAVPRHKPSGHGTSQQVADARGVSELSD